MNLLPNNPLVLPYMGVFPVLMGPVLRSEAGGAILGRVTMGSNAVLEPFAVLRGDGHVIQVGSEFHFGEHSTAHIAHELYSTTIGDNVTVGANVVVHGCTVGNDCVIQDHVLVLDGAVIGDGSVIARDSVVFPRSILPPGKWCEGMPAVPVRPVGAAELRALHDCARANTPSLPVATPHASCSIEVESDTDGYVAATVTGIGEILMGDVSSLWYGCVIDAANHGVTIAARSNVQDNCVLRSGERPITIGEDCTVGHNVLLNDCTIGARVLVGMGSTLAAGTVIMHDVLVAAGSTTSQGQVLESGWLWGGRPARRLSRLDNRKYQIIHQSAVIYGEYAREFAVAQASLLRCHTE